MKEGEIYAKPALCSIDVESRDFFLQKTQKAFRLAKIITNSRSPLFLYGGTVRNLLLGVETSRPDFDFIGNFDLDEIQKKYERLIVDRWDNVSTIRVKIDQEIFDFTSAQDVELRLSQNDITISNFCMTDQGEIIDYFNAFESLVNREIKILNADEKISKDPSRILRVFRFAAELNFKIEDSTLTAAIKNAYRLETTKDLDEDIYQILELEDDKRKETLRLLRLYGVDRYLNLPEQIMNSLNILQLEKEVQRYTQVETIASMFETKLYLVGGAVRDFIWSKNIVDLDFKVLMPVEKMIQILENNGFKRRDDYHTSEGEYYKSTVAGVIGCVINGVDIHLAEIKTTDLTTLIDEGDVNFSCCVYNAQTRKIENPEIIREIKDKKLFFCNPVRAREDELIVLNALKQISRLPDIIIPNETRNIIEDSIPKVVQFVKNNPDMRYKLTSLCGNINSQMIYKFFDGYREIFEGKDKKKEKLKVSSSEFVSVNIKDLPLDDKEEIVTLMVAAYGKHFDELKLFGPNISSVVYQRRNGKIVSCCTIDGERAYSVAARESADWSGILSELVRNNYTVWGTVDCMNSKIQALCSVAGMAIENDPHVIRRILTSNTEKYKEVSIYEINGMTVFQKTNTKEDYPQVLVRS